MIRNLLAVVAGYLTLAVCVMAFTAVVVLAFPDYAAAETDGVVPTLPAAIQMALSGIGAAAGGFVTALIARKAPMTCALVLAGLLFALGLVYAAMSWGGPQPGWYLAAMPVIGAAGVVAGGWLRKRMTVLSRA